MSIFIRRSPEEVFDYVLDLEQMSRWRPRMSRVRWVGHGPPGVGSSFEVVVSMLGIRFPFVVEVTAFDPPRYFGYRTVRGAVQADDAMEWVADGDGCRFFLGGVVTTRNVLLKLTTPIFRSRVFWENYQDLVRLKAILEDEPPAATEG